MRGRGGYTGSGYTPPTVTTSVPTAPAGRPTHPNSRVDWTPVDVTGPALAAVVAEKPQALSTIYGLVVAVDQPVNPTAAQVRCTGDTDAIWVPLEVAGVTQGARVEVAFRVEGAVAVVTVAQE